MDDTVQTSLRARLGAVLETVLNLAVRIDPDLPGELAALEGRSLGLTWSGPQWGLRLWIEQGAIRLGPDPTAADLSVASTLSGLLSLLKPDPRGGLPVGRVSISGDAELLRRIEQIARRFAPDWDAAFARHLGPVLGPQIGRALSDGLVRARAASRDLIDSAVEYVRDERGDVVHREELDGFADEVDGLRDDVERLAARVARLGNPA